VGDARPSLDVPFAAFGLAATLAHPGETPYLPHAAEVAVTGVWLPADASAVPPGLEVSALEPRHRLAFRRSEVPSLRTGAIVKMPEVQDGPVKTWRVDVIDEASAEEIRCLVLPVEPQFS
jgi:hypothetical protein